VYSLTKQLGEKKKPGGLKWRIFIQFIVAGLTIFLFLGGLYYYDVKKENVSAFLKQSQVVVDRYEKKLQAFYRDEMEMLLSYYTLAGNNMPEAVVSLLEQNPHYLSSFLLDASGTVLYASDPLIIGYNYAGKDVFKKALLSGEPFTLTRFHHTERRLAIDLVIPLCRESGSPAYVAVHQLNPAWLVEKLSREYIDGEGEILMFNEDGIIFLDINNNHHSPSGEDSLTARLPSLKEYGFSLSHLQEWQGGPRSFQNNDYLVT